MYGQSPAGELLVTAHLAFLAGVRQFSEETAKSVVDLCNRRRYVEAMRVAVTARDEELATIVLARAFLARNFRRGETRLRVIEIFAERWMEVRAAWFSRFLATLQCGKNCTRTERQLRA